MIKNVRKKFLGLVMTLTILSMVSISVCALMYSDSFYNSISWTWEYNAPATDSYNCLGYATGSMDYEWPWGASNPTSAQVDSYFNDGIWYNYTSHPYGSPYQPKIISYGSSSSIKHFSKVPVGASGYCIAKWGPAERFKHYSWSPYYSSSVYGSAVRIYN